MTARPIPFLSRVMDLSFAAAVKLGIASAGSAFGGNRATDL